MAAGTLVAIPVSAHGPQAGAMELQPRVATARSAISPLAVLATARLVHAPLTMVTSTTTAHSATTHLGRARSEALPEAAASEVLSVAAVSEAVAQAARLEVAVATSVADDAKIDRDW